MNPDAEVAIIMTAVGHKDNVREQESAITMIYDRYAVSLFRYALALVSSREDAEDVVQDVFINIAREPGRLRDIKSIKPYLYTAARNTAFSLLRSRQRRERLQHAACETFLENPGGNESDVTQSMILCQALTRMPVEQREVLVLKIYEDLTFVEIARLIGKSRFTVASRYRYGIEKLRQALEGSSNE